MLQRDLGFNNAPLIWLTQFDIQAEAFKSYLTLDIVPADYKNLVSAIFDIWQAHNLLKLAADGRMYDPANPKEVNEQYYRDNVEAGKKALRKALESLEGA